VLYKLAHVWHHNTNKIRSTNYSYVVFIAFGKQMHFGPKSGIPISHQGFSRAKHSESHVLPRRHAVNWQSGGCFGNGWFAVVVVVVVVVIAGGDGRVVIGSWLTSIWICKKINFWCKVWLIFDNNRCYWMKRKEVYHFKKQCQNFPATFRITLYSQGPTLSNGHLITVN